MKLTKKKGLIAIVLVAAIALMGFGFAAWTQDLTVNGTAQADASWEIVITDVKSVSMDAAEIENFNALANGSETTYGLGDITFSLPGGWAYYEVTVTNKGSIDALAKNVTIAPTTTDKIEVTVGAIDAGTEIIAADGGKCTFGVLVQDKTVPNSDEAAEMTYGDAAIDFSVTVSYEANYEVEDLPDVKHEDA